MSNELATTEAYTPPKIKTLNRYAESGISEDAPEMVWRATISAGKMGPDGKTPQISRDGEIYLHEDRGPAEGLREALARTGGKKLTITFLDDDPNKVFTQLFVAYGKQKIIGDEKSLTVSEVVGDNVVRKTYAFGTPGYTAARALCKESTFIWFALAEWGEDGMPYVVFPDGLQPYRLRTTSVNTVRNLKAALNTALRITKGRLAGIPFEIALEMHNTLTPYKAQRRDVPAFTFVFNPPRAVMMRTFDLAAKLAAGINDAGMLALPAVSDNIRSAIVDEIEAEIIEDDEAMTTLTTGISADLIKAQYFSLTKGTPYAEEGGRTVMMRAVSNALYEREISSLKEFADDIMDAPNPVALWQRAAEYIAGRIADEYPVAAAEPRIAHKRNSMGDNKEADPFAEAQPSLAEIMEVEG
jgi:hypothetical protein